jgi:3'-phosphoadenosine 5'-phosphosulfate sulfotransferase (PAPS reductase)/FAD synthetase
MSTKEPIVVCWWSGGITSAVACLKAIEKWDASPVFIETGAHHPDTERFKKDCEKWYKREILTLQTPKYLDHFDVIEKTRYINGPAGARCTTELKRKVREEWEKTQNIKGYVWGFETKEEHRATRIQTAQPSVEHYFPLLEEGLSKQDCIALVQRAGIEVPEMYKLGFNNNNCIGCVKGGMAYWNMIRKHFPDYFDKMAKLERKLGNSCLKQYFLDELPVNAGRGTKPLVQDCGATGEGCLTELSRQYFTRE